MTRFIQGSWCIRHYQKQIHYTCTRIIKVFLTYLLWTVTHTHKYIYTIVCAAIINDNIYFMYRNFNRFPTINSFILLQVVYSQMATNTTGKINLGHAGESETTYYNCVLHVNTFFKKYQNVMRNLCHTHRTELNQIFSKFVLFLQMKRSIYPHLQAKKVYVNNPLHQFLLTKTKTELNNNRKPTKQYCKRLKENKEKEDAPSKNSNQLFWCKYALQRKCFTCYFYIFTIEI